MEIIHTDRAPAAVGPYSQAVRSGGFIFTSGQIAIDPADNTVKAATIEEQTEQVCRNLCAVLEAAGSGLDRVIKTVCFLADMGDFAAFNAVYAKYFPSLPARSCVAVKALPKGVMVEVECVAEA